MGIYESIPSELKTAMKARDKARTQALRNIRAALLAAAKEDGSDTVSDEAALTVLRRLAKQRKESIEAYEAGGRAEMAEAEKAELAVVESFLPQQADEAQTQAWVDAAVAEVGATSMREMGKVMGVLMRDHKGAIDGKLANQLVRKALS